MSIERLLNRTKKIRVEIITDTGEKLVSELSREELLKIPCLTIHGMSSILSYIEGRKLEDWIKKNPPRVTELQIAVKKGIITATKLEYASCEEVYVNGHAEMLRRKGVNMSKTKVSGSDNKTIFVYKTWIYPKGGSASEISFQYDSLEDFREDLEYCKNLIKNSNGK